MREIATRFTELTGHETVVSFGSTGKLYAQIINGAPFEVFLAADQERPRLLHGAGLGSKPATYATGRLVLWSPDPARVSGSDALAAGDVQRIAIANPKTAPYGSGAMQVIEALGLTGKVSGKLVRGDNIAQTYQFVVTRNAQLGFVAYSQVAMDTQGSYWVPPQSMYAPLHQDMLLLQRGTHNPAAVAFVEFMRGEEARAIARRFGYDVD